MRPFDLSHLWVPQLHPLEVMLRTVLVYLFAWGVMRLLGRKELGRYSSFDLSLLVLITVCLRTSVLGNDSSLTSAFLALSTLAALERLFSWLSFRSRRVAVVLEGRPLELVREGQLVHENLRRGLLSYEELLSRLRAHGTEELHRVRTAWLEPDGKVTFLLQSPEESKAVNSSTSSP